MVLAIICFALELICAAILPAILMAKSTLSIAGGLVTVRDSETPFRILAIIYAVFALIEILCIIYNSIKIKKSSRKGKFITGVVFSAIGTTIAVWACIVFMFFPKVISLYESVVFILG